MFDDSKPLFHLVTLAGVTISVVALTRYFRSRGFPNQPKPPYPPGPKGLPFVGNILDLPRDMHMWEGFAQMAETYRTSMILAFRWNRNLILRAETEVMYLNMFGTDMVVLNSSEAIADLLDKKSAIYSDKVTSYVSFVQPGSNTASFLTIAPITDSGTNGYR